MKVFSSIVGIVGTVCLCVTLFAAGYFACAFPLTTEVLSQNTSNFEDSPYTLDDLNVLAVASRDYTVDPRPEGTSTEDARAIFNTAVMNAATHSAQRFTSLTKDDGSDLDRAKKQLWTNLLFELKANTPNNAFGKEDVNDVAEKMAAVSDCFAFDEDAFQHLDDCNALINGLIPVIRIVSIIALVCFLLLLVTRRWRALGRMLTVAPLILIISFAFMGTWAVIDFASFFTAFHGIFFPQGNWMFDYDSLLICMYPTAFWMGMGALWLATTAAASIIVLFIGRGCSGHADRLEDREYER